MLCERLHVLPNAGGLLQQEEMHVKRLLKILEHIDDFNEEEMKKKK